MQDLKCTYKVIGILDKDVSMIVNSELMFLDRYILSPALTFENTPESYTELMYQGFSYLQKINGTIELADDFSMKDFIIELENLRLRYNIFDIVILNHSIAEINALKFLVYENAKTLFMIFALTLVFSLITLFSYMLYKIKLNTHFYKVCLLSGYGVKDIKRMINLEILVPVSVSFLLVIFFLNIYMENNFAISVVFISSVYILVNIISFILTNIFFNKINLEMLSKGEEND